MTRLAQLRNEMVKQGVDAYLIPRTDEFQSEYPPDYALRLEWLTGFSGSAGMALAGREKALLMTDGRYETQVGGQIDPQQFDVKILQPGQNYQRLIAEWVRQNMAPKQRLGVDPWLMTVVQVEELKKLGVEVVPLTENLIDLLWAEQPSPPTEKAEAYPVEFAGQASVQKRQAVFGQLDNSVDHLILTQLDSIAWLLNVRGRDVNYNPFVLSYAVLHRDGMVDWFIDETKVEEGLIQDVRLHPLESFVPFLSTLKASVHVDPTSCPQAVLDAVKTGSAKVRFGIDPCQDIKAQKNDIEIEGAHKAMIWDGAALVKFFHWLHEEVPKGGLTEVGAQEKLQTLRRSHNQYLMDSFATISGSGPNGAIIHYRATPETDRPLSAAEIYLVDSGAQYYGATTDVTRTLSFAPPTAEQQDRYTRVLKGHIALSRVVFPRGTSGRQLDTIARQFLWQVGCDYNHGTGHGVGSCLGVHEGPASISKRATGEIALQPGMILSNEPGYYKPGAYGIRIENLLLVVEQQVTDDRGQPLLGFETLTLAPYDRQLIDVDLLTAGEKAWINDYHQRVLKSLQPHLSGAALAWLKDMTAGL